MAEPVRAIVLLRDGLAPNEKALLGKYGGVGDLGLVEIPAQSVMVLDPIYLRVEYEAMNGRTVVLDIPHLSVLVIRREMDPDSRMGFVYGPDAPANQPPPDHGSSGEPKAT